MHRASKRRHIAQWVVLHRVILPWDAPNHPGVTLNTIESVVFRRGNRTSVQGTGDVSGPTPIFELATFPGKKKMFRSASGMADLTAKRPDATFPWKWDSACKALHHGNRIFTYQSDALVSAGILSQDPKGSTLLATLRCWAISIQFLSPQLISPMPV
jgi:hypothetical protein